MKKVMFMMLRFFFSVLIFTSCTNWNWWELIKSNDKQEQNQKIEKPVIYTSFYPIYFLVKSFVWENADVINLVPAWWEPHEYEPTLKQISEMWKSNLIVLNWLWIESYEGKLVQNIKNVPIITLSEKLDNLIKLGWNTNTDPHTWLSPKEYIEIANALVLELEKKWFTNLDKSILQKLNDLDVSYTEWLKNCSQKEIVTSHEAFWYLARDYGFSQHAIMWISPEQEPSLKDIAWVIELVKKDNLKYIFSEEFVSPRFSDTVKKETWVQVLNLHPLETISSDEEIAKEDYLSIMDKNLEKLKLWLECK